MTTDKRAEFLASLEKYVTTIDLELDYSGTLDGIADIAESVYGRRLAPQVSVPSEGATRDFYLSLLPKIREVARAAGYAIGVHGSLVRDFDLIAVPWVDNALSGEQLAHAIKAIAGGQIKPAFSMTPGDTGNKNPGRKPHGRIVWTILLTEGSDARFIDLSVMPPAPPQPAATPAEPPAGVREQGET